jgi:hypothetical protein
VAGFDLRAFRQPGEGGADSGSVICRSAKRRKVSCTSWRGYGGADAVDKGLGHRVEVGWRAIAAPPPCGHRRSLRWGALAQAAEADGITVAAELRHLAVAAGAQQLPRLALGERRLLARQAGSGIDAEFSTVSP